MIEPKGEQLLISLPASLYDAYKLRREAGGQHPLKGGGGFGSVPGRLDDGTIAR